MKYSLGWWLLALTPVVVFALPCPKGGGVLYKGDSLQKVLQTCGPPLATRTNTETINTSQEWIYNRHQPYAPGYYQLIVLIENKHVKKIHINDNNWFALCTPKVIQIGPLITTQVGCFNTSYDVVNTTLCGQIFGIGDNEEVVKSLCGIPDNKTELENNIYEVTELIYGDKHYETIIFENGHLVDWR